MIWRYLDQFIVINKFDGLLEGEFNGRCEHNVLIRAGRSHIRQLLAFNGIDRKIIPSGMNSNNHPLIDFFVWIKK